MRSYSFLLVISICSLASITAIKKMKMQQDYSHWQSQVIYSGLSAGILNPRASSYHSYHLRSENIKLSSPFGLCFASNDPDPEVNLGALGVVNVHGFSIKGRADAAQFSNKVEVTYTLDGEIWQTAGRGVYDQMTNGDDTFTYIFDKTVQALAIRFEVKKWTGFPCLKLEVFVSRVSAPHLLVKNWEKEMPAIALGIGRVNAPYIHDVNHSSDGLNLDFKYSDVSSKAWCGNAQKTNYFEISTGRVVEWTKLVTQGRYDAYQFVKAYTLEYTLNGYDWIRYKSGTTLSGNEDQNSQKIHILEKFFAHTIRLYPTSYQGHPCMRAEAYFRNNGWWGFGGNNFY